MADRTHHVVELFAREVLVCVDIAGETLAPVVSPVLLEERKAIECQISKHKVMITDPIHSLACLYDSAELFASQEFQNLLEWPGRDLLEFRLAFWHDFFLSLFVA
jgi:hypothetical protein